MTIEKKINNIIWNHMESMTINEATKEILSLFRIEVDCPECGGTGKQNECEDCGVEFDKPSSCEDCTIDQTCFKCNGTLKISKPIEPDDVGRII